MALPSAATFPTPTMFPESQPSFTYGLTEEDRQLQQLGVGAQEPQLTSFRTFAPAAAAAAPTWTPEEAAAQTDRALARIAQVNPELAQSIAAQREGAEVKDDGSWLGDIFGAVSDVAKKGFFGVLDVLDRASHIIPEMLYDDKDSVWENLGDALSGESDIRWRDVLEDKWGWERSWVTQVAGFVGDVVTDPLTYVTTGLGGIGRATVAATAREVGVRSFLTGSERGMLLIDDLVTKGSKTLIDDAARAGISVEEAAIRGVLQSDDIGRRLAETASNSVMGRLRQAVGWAAPEVRDGMWFQLVEQTESAALREALQIGSDAFRLASTQNMWTVTAKEAAKLGIDKKAFDDIARQMIREGSGFGVKRAAYTKGREAAALFGGVRLRMPMPMLGFRFQTSRILPFTQHLNFQSASRFFAGMSAAKKMGHLMGRGVASVDDWARYMEGGLNGRWVGKGEKQWLPGLKQTNPELAYQMTHGRNFVGSALYPLSEAVGAVTAKFSPSAAVVRGGGWGLYQASNLRKQASHAIQTLHDGHRTLTDSDGRIMNVREVEAALVKGWGDLSDPEARRLLDQVLATHAVGQAWDETPEAFFDPLIKQARDNGQLELATQLTSQRDAQAAVWAQLKTRGADFERASRMWVQIGMNMDETRRTLGDGGNIVHDSLYARDELRPGTSGMDQLTGNNHEAVAGARLVPENPDVMSGPLDSRTMQSQGRSGVNTVRGTHFHIPAEGATEPEVVTKTEIDELVREGSGGAGIGMFAAMDPDPTSLWNRLAGKATGDTTFDELTRDLTEEEIGEVRRVLDRNREIRAGMAAKAEEATAQAAPTPVVNPEGDWDAVEPGEGYVLHATSQQNYEKIAESGRVELGVGAFRDVAEGTDQRVYGGATGASVRGQGEVLLRFKKRPGHWSTDPNNLDWQYSGNPVTQDIEVWTGEGWKPIPAKREVVGQTAEGSNVVVITQREVDKLVGPRAGDATYGAELPADKTYFRDKSTNPAGQPLASSPTDEFGEVETQAREFLEREKQRAMGVLNDTKLSEETKATMDPALRKIIEEEGTRDIAAIMEKWLKARGYTAGIVTKTDDGLHVTVFRRDDGLQPFARLNPNAPHVGVGLLGAPRALTRDARIAVHRMPRLRQLPGGGENWLLKQLRAVAHLDHESAEAELRDRLSEIGVALHPSQRVLETDTYKVMREYSKQVAQTAGNRQMGFLARELEKLGHFDSIWRGTGISQSSPFEFVVNEGNFRSYEKYMHRLEKAEKRAAKWQASGGANGLIAQAQRVVEQLESRLANLQSRVTYLASDAASQGRGTLFAEEHIAAYLGQIQSMFRTLSDGGEQASVQRFRRLTDNMFHWAEDVVDEDTGIAKTTDVYVWVEDGRVVSARLIGANANPLHRSVSAFTAPDSQGKGFGAALHEQDWADRGIIGNADPEVDLDKAAEAILAQTLSKAGGKLNASAIKKMGARIKQQLEEAMQAEVEMLQKQAVEAALDTQAVNKLVADLRHRRSPVIPALVPAENARNMTGFQRVMFPNQEEFAMPVFMAQEFMQAMDGFPTLTGFHKQWRQFNSWWKSMATWLWPGFHVRNAAGSFFNNSLGGVGFKSYVAAGRVQRAMHEMANFAANDWKLARQKVRLKDGNIIAGLRRAGYKNFGGVPIEDLTYGDLAVMMTSMGVGSGNGRTFAEAELAAEAAERVAAGGTPVERRIPPLRAYKRAARGAGTMTENTFRFAAFLHGVDAFGDLNEARAFTMVRHGDYTDLTDMEFTWIRDLIPFYKWMRTNLPFQIHQLLENPGALLTAKKGMETAFELSGRDWEEEKYRMPDWMQNQLIVPFGDKDEAFNAVMMDLPISDLSINGREFMSSFLPLVRPFIESFVYEKNTFSGAPLEGDMQKLGGAFAPIAPLLKALGLAQAGEDGDYMSDKYTNLVSMIPLFSRARNWMYADEDRVQLRANTVASAIFGVGLRPVDQEQLVQTELDFYYTHVLPAVDHLKQMGYPVPTTDDMQAAGAMTDTVLTSLGITPNTALVAQ